MIPFRNAARFIKISLHWNQILIIAFSDDLISEPIVLLTRVKARSVQDDPTFDATLLALSERDV